MAGIGRRMPLTPEAFVVAAVGMAGIPFIAGFVSKYFMLLGTASAGQIVFTGALLDSGVLNIAYFWPVVYTAFFESAGDTDAKPLVEGPLGGRFAASDSTGETAADGGRPTDGGDDRPAEGDSWRVTANDAADDSEHTSHHTGTWERRAPTGAESTWFMPGPILFTAAGSVVLGIVPDTAVFLRLVRLVVAGATGVNV